MTTIDTTYSPTTPAAPTAAQQSGTRTVVFRDQSAGVRYLTRSDRPTDLSTTWEDGNVYPVIEVDLSSAAHLASHRHARTTGPVGRSGRARHRREKAASARS
ncbi:type B 50S ribosomal protein L31 [Brachybacterium alimentarium]|uniref:type B 50S ribosomal protein L31 n=1 Tax=Brachybacterium alimentarium TaxID=47845 RepID=UPI003FD535BE